jgi:hypothetical protein
MDPTYWLLCGSGFSREFIGVKGCRGSGFSREFIGVKGYRGSGFSREFIGIKGNRGSDFSREFIGVKGNRGSNFLCMDVLIPQRTGRPNATNRESSNLLHLS